MFHHQGVQFEMGSIPGFGKFLRIIGFKDLNKPGYRLVEIVIPGA
jgi:hypothetical protein